MNTTCKNVDQFIAQFPYNKPIPFDLIAKNCYL